MVSKQQKRFAVGRSVFDQIQLGINVTLCNKDVQPAIIVHIDKPGAPSDRQKGRLPDAGAPGYVDEATLALIPEEKV